MSCCKHTKNSLLLSFSPLCSPIKQQQQNPAIILHAIFREALVAKESDQNGLGANLVRYRILELRRQLLIALLVTYGTWYYTSKPWYGEIGIYLLENNPATDTQGPVEE